MSLFHRTDLYVKQSSDRKTNDYGFILALVCIVLVLVIASVLTPVSVGHGLNSDTWSVGP
jgi:hypothetical protein